MMPDDARAGTSAHIGQSSASGEEDSGRGAPRSRASDAAALWYLRDTFEEHRRMPIRDPFRKRLDAVPIAALVLAVGSAACGRACASEPGEEPARASGLDPKAKGAVVIATAGSPSGIVVDDEAVYFADATSGSIVKLAKPDLALSILVRNPNPRADDDTVHPALLRADRDFLYFYATEWSLGGVSTVGATLQRVAKHGGAATVLSPVSQSGVGCLAVDANRGDDGELFWSVERRFGLDPDDVVSSPTILPRMRVSRRWAPNGEAASEDTGPTHTKKYRRFSCVAIDEQRAYYAGREADAPSSGLLVDRSPIDVYAVARKGGETPRRLANGSCDAMALDDDAVYCAGDDVFRVKKSGGEKLVLWHGEGGAHALAIAVGGNEVFFSTLADHKGAIHRVPKEGGATTTLKDGLGEPTDVAVDATHVYWTTTNGTQHGGSVWRAER